MKLTERKLAELRQIGAVRQELDGSITQLKKIAQTAPPAKTDNSKRSWKVHGIERDQWDGYITSVAITEQ